jgi:5,5'-dehydrodivanillate O-demethylase
MTIAEDIMLSAEDNELFTRIGPGTPCGNLMRRYWMPVACASEISAEKPIKKVRVLGEDLVLFRDGQGRMGLLPERCPHRHASLYYGFAEDDGLRCAYHGWKFDVNGECIEQPYERAGGPLMKQACLKSYPVQQLAGLLFAYLGPDPVPLLPRWETLVRKDGVRDIVVLPIHHHNWLQAQENSHDPTHTFWLHARLYERALKDRPEERKKWAADLAYFGRPIESFDFELCREESWTGIRKVRTYGGDNPEKEAGHPAIFPNILIAPQQRFLTTHFRVPIDDTHTKIYWVEFLPNEDGSITEQADEDIPVTFMDPPRRNEDEDYRLDHFVYQDQMAWETQGAIADRTTELIGAGDRGIVMYRNLLREQIAKVQAGQDPDGVIRDPALNDMIRFTFSHGQADVAKKMATEAAE